jgi:hypothetical protein
MLKIANFQRRKIETDRKSESSVEQEMKNAEINTLINGSF